MIEMLTRGVCLQLSFYIRAKARVQTLPIYLPYLTTTYMYTTYMCHTIYTN